MSRSGTATALLIVGIALTGGLCCWLLVIAAGAVARLTGLTQHFNPDIATVAAVIGGLCCLVWAIASSK